MNKKIKQMLSRGERSNIEFKECARDISSTVYETVCAFLNTKGETLHSELKITEILSELPKSILLQLNKTSLLL
ncbi:hypothetical protein ATZ36_07930 [Candidatus Endomicrobiellum trichonymphae]|uniref:Uncharacterized protein n=1 Tax=Endomicrobium trichonymphae TaxID=1408204 RepID=A0A1E5IGT4_ENDTX|nr:hypothetical protein ATZ36_07930 [Candidatus Endomicrobium trichonymphae]